MQMFFVISTIISLVYSKDAAPAPDQKDLPCDMTCTAYLKYAFQHGLAEDDVSAWCTSGLDFCYSGNCKSDCEFNLHQGRHWNNVDCTAVCHGAMGSRQLEEQKVEVAAPAPAQKDLPCDITCPAYLKYAFQHGLAEDDVSRWCTSELDFCYSGNCMSDCEFNLHQGRHWNNVDCKAVCHGAMGGRQLEEQKVEVAAPAPAQDDLPCSLTCTAYLKYAFQHGLAEDDVSRWCTSELDFCYSGNCMSDCEFNLHQGRHWNNVDCKAVCHGAMGSRQLEEQKVEEQKVEVAAPAPVQDNLPCSTTCMVYLKYAFQTGLAEYDVSRWCTSELDFCYSGNCMSDCELNLHQGRHWNNVDCRQVCHNARGATLLI